MGEDIIFFKYHSKWNTRCAIKPPSDGGVRSRVRTSGALDKCAQIHFAYLCVRRVAIRNPQLQFEF